MRHITYWEQEFYSIDRPQSSFISDVTFYFGVNEYDEITEDLGNLQVTLNGIEYEYRNFPLFLFMELANSESLGRFFNERIRNKYYATTPEC